MSDRFMFAKAVVDGLLHVIKRTPWPSVMHDSMWNVIRELEEAKAACSLAPSCYECSEGALHEYSDPEYLEMEEPGEEEAGEAEDLTPRPTSGYRVTNPQPSKLVEDAPEPPAYDGPFAGTAMSKIGELAAKQVAYEPFKLSDVHGACDALLSRIESCKRDIGLLVAEDRQEQGSEPYVLAEKRKHLVALERHLTLGRCDHPFDYHDFTYVRGEVYCKLCHTVMKRST